MNMPILSQVTNLNSDDREILNQANEISLATGEEPMNIQSLEQRNNCIKHVEQISPLLDKIGTAATYSLEDYSSLKAKVESSTLKARQNSLAIATVGTMKAGKSTSQAALFGFLVAPARNSAATSIPTTFVYTPSLKDPKLEVSDGVLKMTDERLAQVRELIKQDELSSIQERLNSHPQAKGLLPQIISKELDQYFREIPTLCEQICNYLEKLNDFHRVCSMLSIVKPEIQEYPDVFTPFYGITTPLDGICTFYDTPGRNEAGQSDDSNLFELILNQTQKVILVANYGELGTQAFKNVKDLCNDIIKLRGKDSLLVLVNQIDRRQSSRDMTKEEVIELFQTQLGIEANQIIEVSSLQALQASSTRRDLEISSFPPHQLESVKQLAGIYNSLKSTTESGNFLNINTATKHEILEAADKVWKNSGFKNFVEVIESLLENSKHETLKAALTLGQNSLKQGIQDISATKQRLTQEELLSEELGKQLEQTIRNSQVTLKSLKESCLNSFSAKSKERTNSLLNSDAKFYSVHEAKDFLRPIQETSVAIVSSVWNEIKQELSDNLLKIQSDIIAIAQQLDLKLPPINLDILNITFSPTGLEPFPKKEPYQEPVLVNTTKWIKEKVVEKQWSQDSPFHGHHFYVDYWIDKEVPHQYWETINKERDIYMVETNHKDHIINQACSQVAHLFQSPEMINVLSLEAYKNLLKQHLTQLKEDFESKLRDLNILELEAQEKLKLLSADLDSIE